MRLPSGQRRAKIADFVEQIAFGSIYTLDRCFALHNIATQQK
jgi:hypothetical protein